MRSDMIVTVLFVIIAGTGADGNFELLTKSATFTKARTKCQSKGLDLAKVSNQQDLDAIEDIVRRTATRDCWLGMQYDGVAMRWLDGSVVAVSRWDDISDDEPDNLKNQQCAVVREDLLWDSKECDKKYLPLCGPVANVTATTMAATTTTMPATTTTMAATTTTTTTTTMPTTTAATTTTATTTATTPATTTIPTTTRTTTTQAPLSQFLLGRNLTTISIALTTSTALGLDEGFAQQPILSFEAGTITECYVTCSDVTQCTHFVTTRRECRLYASTDGAPRTSEPGATLWKKG